MSYEPVGWVDGKTPVNAENLGKMDDGIKAANDAVDEINTARENGEFKGEDGKSAYEYAQDGGYTGTKEDFAEKLAREIPTKTSQLENNSGFITSAPVTSVNGKTGAVTIDIPAIPTALKNPNALTINGTAYDGSKAVSVETPKTLIITGTDGVSNKTSIEIWEAVSAGYTVFCFSGGMYAPLVSLQDTIASFSLTIAGGTDGFVTIFASVDTDGVITEDMMFTSALPNPNALTFTGAVTGSYDGSEAKTVNIPTVPTALKNPNALTINGTTYDGSKAVSMTIGGSDSIPEYIKTEADRVAKVVQSHQNANTITFLACSDIHYYSPDNATANANAEKMHEAVVSMGQAMGLIRERCHIDFAVKFGDMTWDSGETHDEQLAEMRFVNSCLHRGFSGIPQFRTEGNHDGDNDLTAAEVFANIGAWNEGAVYGNRASGYCYRDFDSVKLRVICLNSSEYSGSAAQYNPEQVTWLATALNLSEKGAGWRSIILGHHPLDWGRNGGTDPTATINAASGLIASFHGHIHNFLTGTVTNTELPRIAIPNAGYSRENQYDEAYGINWKESTTYSKTPGTAENTSFCVITIDTDAKKIYADHYGAGYDRVIPYDDVVLATYTVINNLSNVTTSSAATSVEEGKAYSATLTANSGYAISAVTVTMGGTDITATAYSGGKINISSVTGNIVVTAIAVESSEPDEPVAKYTNLIPTATEYGSDAVYNGVGYKNGVYISSSAAPYEGTDAATVTTGYIPYVTGSEMPGTIYIKGAEWAALSHVRLYFFNGDKSIIPVYLNGNTTDTTSNSCLEKFYTKEVLGDLYYKLTPIKDESTSNWIGYIAAGKLHDVEYIRFSLKGTGENLIITYNEPIE